MKANELRIGNWVNCIRYSKDGYYTCVEGIGQFGIDPELGYDGLNTTIDYTAGFNMIEPIPLTKDWLVKFGFDQNNVDIEKYDCKWYKFSFTLDYWNAQKFFVYGYIGGNKTIKHVHQLQNLYFALTGEELEIKDK